MVCTYCSANTQVTNSRLQKRTNSVWRRRKCTGCGAIFSTTEYVDHEKSWVVQYTDKQLSPFLRDKLFVSIFQSCQHRPTALPDAIGLADTVIAAANKQVNQGTLPAKAIAIAAHETLKRFDQAAATHYQAFHADIL